MSKELIMSDVPLIMTPVGSLVPEAIELRDYFAGQALVGFLNTPVVGEGLKGKEIPMSFARDAYEMADFMLLARKERG